ncbi:MAG: coproporphyrinogen III oxidase family protein, partial [Bacteroidales bacterium]|nr:coproporphyrinogen III oxidase family protein [Bacteroidales bacterium]
MAGIYIHIPFCRSKCHYCNFFSLATSKFRNEFYDALLKEIDLTRDYLGNEPVETVYFGGGTPSLLPVGWIEEILGKIRDAHPSPNPSPAGEGSKSPSGDLGAISGIRHPAS